MGERLLSRAGQVADPQSRHDQGCKREDKNNLELLKEVEYALCAPIEITLSTR
jgi:hypothetical protein